MPSVIVEIADVMTADKIDMLNSRMRINSITGGIDLMEFLTKLSKVCKSNKDIDIVNILLDMHDEHNVVDLKSISSISKVLGVTRNKTHHMLSKMLSTQLLYKITHTTYFINPYIFIGKNVTSNEKRLELQKTWSEYVNN